MKLKKLSLTILLSIICVFAFVFGFVGIGATTAFGADATQSHTHCSCGLETDVCDRVYLDHHKDIDFPVWESATRMPFRDEMDPSDSSALPKVYYYLANDVTLSDKWEIQNEGKICNITICLYDHTITDTNSSEETPVIEIWRSGKLYLTTCGLNSMDGNAEITHTEGTLGSGIWVGGQNENINRNKGEFYFYGGNIVKNTSTTNGGGVWVLPQGVFEMHRGSISDNTTNGNGGGVYNTGKFDMYGGDISGNTANGQGDGVYNTNIFNMTGGTISGAGVAIENTGAMTISGGTVSGSQGIRNVDNGTVKLSGNPTISSTLGTADICCLSTNEGQIDAEGYTGKTLKLSIDGTTDGQDNFDLMLNKVIVKNTTADKFILVDSMGNTYTDYALMQEGNDLVLAKPHTHDNITFDTEWTAVDGAVDSGNYYLTQDVTATAMITIAGTVNLCLNGYTIDLGNSSLLSVSNGAIFNIYDCSADGTGEVTSANTLEQGTLYNEETLVIHGGNIVNTASGGTAIRSLGTLSILSGTVNGSKYAIFNNDGTVNISGGIVQSYEDDAIVITGENGAVYLSGNPTISTEGTKKADIYRANQVATDGFLYAHAAGDTSNKFIGTIDISLYSLAEGTVAVSGATEDQKDCFNIINEGGYILLYNANGGTLVVHKHDMDSWKVDENKHWHECTCGENTAKVSHNLWDSSCTECGIHIHDGIVFDKALSAGATNMVLESGNYYLPSDVNLSSSMNTTIGGNVKICLGNYTLNFGYNGTLTVPEGKTLEIYACGTSGTLTGANTNEKKVIVNNGTLKIHGGIIYETSNAIAIENNGILEISGGKFLSLNQDVIKNTSAGVVYLSKNAVITSNNANKAGIYRENKNDPASCKVYAHANGDESDIFTGTASISLYTLDEGTVAVYGVTDEHLNKFTLINQHGYLLIQAGANLLTHKHDFDDTDVCACGLVKISEKTFPDENFRAYITNLDYDEDGILDNGEIAYCIGINVYDTNIQSLEGIQFFPNITRIICYSNNISQLDLSALKELTYLDCQANNLTSLDVSNNTKLIELYCGNNNISSLDLSNNTALTILFCNRNPLTELDLSLNTELTDVRCTYCKLTELDLSHNTKLTNVLVNDQQIDIEINQTYATFDMNTLGIDLTKVAMANQENAMNDDGVIYVGEARQVTYNYAVGLGDTVMDVTLTIKNRHYHQRVVEGGYDCTKEYNCICGAVMTPDGTEHFFFFDNYGYDEHGHWIKCDWNDCIGVSDYVEHFGGNATCIEKAVCSVCRQTYGEVDAGAHSWNDGEITTPATCATLGVKTFVCLHDSTHTMTEDVALDANNHSKTTFVYTANADGATHTKKYECCGVVVLDSEAHAYGADDKCICGAEKPIPTYTVTVENGTASNGNTSVVVNENGSVTVTANAAPEGKQFKGWSVNGTVVSTKQSYTFKITADTTITAVYEDIPKNSGYGFVIGIGSSVIVLALIGVAVFFIKKKKA